MPMVDISSKEIVKRIAEAEGKIILSEKTLKILPKVEKGDVFEAAQIAGTMAVKNTPKVIPYCHPIPIESVKFDFSVVDDGVVIKCEVKSVAKTGVEMEALVGVTTALLTIWDMVKKYEKDESGNYPNTEIRFIKILRKVKGDAY